MKGWFTQGNYQYHFNRNGFTGWYRAVGGKMKNGLWPEWNYKTGEMQYGT